jgi:hypothetical protein
MRVASPRLPSIEALVMCTGFGKRSCHLDLDREIDRAALHRLVSDSDVFVQSYRPGSLAQRGFGPEDLVRERPGIVVVSISAYGDVGPWAGRRGFDSLVQTASGIGHEGMLAAGTDRPHPLPVQALDHATGYMAAAGAMIALLARMTEGGSWHVKVSLARTGRWLDDAGRVDGGLAIESLRTESVSDLLQTTQSPWGKLTTVSQAGRLNGVDLPEPASPVPLGTHPARWADPSGG